MEIKSFKELVEAKSEHHQLNVRNVLGGQVYTKELGWVTLKLSDELEEQIISKTLDTLGGFQKHKVQMRNALRYGRVHHWGLERMFFQSINNGEDFVIDYCAGQDYPYELGQIRKFLRS